MENNTVQSKIKLLFENITEPEYVMNNYYADGLINKLGDTTDMEISFLATTPLLSDLILEAMDKTDKAHSSVKVFITRTLALAAQKELHFAKIFSKNGHIIAKGFNNINSAEINPSLRVAYLEVALAIVSHNSGIAWLLETGVWKEILSLCNERRTVFVVRQTYKFASTFLWCLNDLGDEASIRQIILNHILKPLTDTSFLHLESLTSEQEQEISKTLGPMLQILLSVVTVPKRIEQPTILSRILINECRITSQLLVVFDRTRKEDMTLLLARVTFWLYAIKIFHLKPLVPGVEYSSEDFMELTVIYFNTIQALVQRRNTTLVLDFCNICNTIWTMLWKDNSVAKFQKIEKETRTINAQNQVQNQLLFICLVPALVYVKKVGNLSTLSNERLDKYICNLLNTTNEHMARAAYALRDMCQEVDLQSTTLQSVKRLTCMKHNLNNEQANLVFQALFYVLKEYDPTNEEGEMKENETYEDSQEKVLVMTYVVDIVLCLVQNHNINWHESLEVLCLYTVLHNILKRPNLSSKFLVTSLNLVAVTIRKFIPPNLSLLMESKPGSAIHDLGKLIYQKMHNINWEVRDSALELLLVCTEISFVKFPPLQKQITENNLINVAAALTFNDHESYVQASALKCLGAASKIAHLWDQLAGEHPNILEQLISTLRNNHEGIVRREACNVLCEVYQNMRITPTFKHTLYEHMVSSAMTDFHWEVQLSALKFWKIVIQSLLKDQGMLDGTFPPVTFSRETRKIVTLNETEIQRRLLRVLDELASIGCLTVLTKLLDEDTEVDILESSLNISLELMNVLNKYKVPDCVKRNEGDAQNVEEIFCGIRDTNDVKQEAEIEVRNTQKSDNVIEGILQSTDLNLLSNIYESQMNLETNDNDPVSPKIKLSKTVSPFLFVDFLKSKDLRHVIEQKKTWKEGIRSISSLLDDVLGIYEINVEANTLDCY